MALSKKNKNNDGPLSGLLVIDTSQGIAGPYCGSILAGYGARVIKVDPPHGDWGRNVGAKYGTSSVYSVAYNRGKEGIVLDLKKEGDLETLYELVAQADIFLESSRPGVAKKIGIDFDKLTEKNASLIYLSISGFGQKGPYAERPCTDGVAQAFSGLVHGNVGQDGMAHKMDIPIVDIYTGLYGFQSVSMALFERMKTGKAQYLDNNLVHSALEVQKAKLIDQHLHGETVAKLNPPSGVYQSNTGDMVIALATEAHYLKLIDVIGADDLKDRSEYETFELRGENDGPLRARIQDIVGRKSGKEWMEILGGAGIIVNTINSVSEVLADENIMASGMLRDVQQAGMGVIRLPTMPLMDGMEADAPELGQHTEQVLRELAGE